MRDRWSCGATYRQINICIAVSNKFVKQSMNIILYFYELIFLNRQNNIIFLSPQNGLKLPPSPRCRRKISFPSFFKLRNKCGK